MGYFLVLQLAKYGRLLGRIGVMYNYSRTDVAFTEVGDRHQEVRFISPFGSGLSGVDAARAYLYPAEPSRSAVIFLPGLGDRNLKHFRRYISGLNQAGFSVILPILPYFYNRKSEERPETSAFLKGASEDLQKKYEHAVTDIRCLIDYLEKKGISSIDIMGISFGGMIALIAMAVDKRIRRGVFIVTGGNYEYLTWKSIATRVFRVKYEEDGSCSPERCRRLHADFDTAAAGVKDPEDLSRFPGCFTYDPSFFAHLLEADRVIMFSATSDPFIPRSASDDLWKRLGKPKRIFLPAGHMTSHVFFKRKIARESVMFLLSKDKTEF